MAREMEKVYEPSAVESRLYAQWEEEGYFHAEPNPAKKPYTIVIPPPNITGQLHMGHALDNTIQDILIRFRRMQGYEALWMPGTDHASIATEVKIVDQMAQEGLSKADIGRKAFLDRAWAWRSEYGGRIVTQLKRLGSSCDWARERFTMDEGCSEAVVEAFVDLYNRGLIYRGNRIINWCPDCRTALSDAEVEYEEQDTSLWHVHYPAEDGGEGITVATTRPETMLGDTAVAVHPDDERYAHLVGKNVILPVTGKPIPVVADAYVEMEFGTGAVKITPAHDPNDYEVALRHDLPMPNVMTEDGHMNTLAGKFAGQTALECRKAVVAMLKAQGSLVSTEPYKHNVGVCYRCQTTVEPLISKQWFVSMKPLAEPAIEAVRSGDIQFVPKRFEKTYFHWMENIRDWCISRQLWWGHRIPAYYCGACGEMTVAKEKPNACKCGSTALRQDEDVLDTWFSSGMWPFSTMGWPGQTQELSYFYPTSVLVTGYDIIFFWVARMIVFGLSQMQEKPFSHVFVHGIVRDAQGRKMSKSLGNGIDPLEIIEKYGADSLRFSLTIGNSPGNDMRFYWEKVEAARNFCNKIWNAARFVLMNLEEGEDLALRPDELELADKWILQRLNECIEAVSGNLEGFDLGLAAQKVYDFLWSEFCDWYIELCKPRLQSDNKRGARSVLAHVLTKTLQLLHPFMPFITEEIFQHLPGTQETIMRSEWPQPDTRFAFAKEAADMETVMDVIRAVRNLRAEMNVPPAKRPHLMLVAQADNAEIMRKAQDTLLRLAGAGSITIAQDKSAVPQGAVSAVTEAAEAFIAMEDLVDIAKERERLQKERAQIQGEIERAQGMLGNAAFVAKAPASVVDAEHAKLKAAQEMLAKVEERIKSL